MKYRHEWKHEIRYGDMLLLRQRLSAVARQDSHAIDGKFRIRYYNHDTSIIHLEKNCGLYKRTFYIRSR